MDHTETDNIMTYRLPYIRYMVFRNRNSVQSWDHIYCDIPGMTIMLSGSLQYTINGKQYKLTEDHVIHYNVGDIICRPAQNTTVRYLAFSYQPGDKKYCLENLIPVLEHQKTLVTQVQNYYFSAHLGVENNLLVSRMILDILLRELESNCQHTESHVRIVRIRNYVLQNYMNGINVQDVAKAVSLHPSYCNSYYKKHTGETISSLLDSVRMNNAQRQLIYTSDSVEKIAFECGFRDSGYFSKWFHKHTGKTPGMFRRE